MQENKVLSLNGDAFSELKEDFDSILDKTLSNMQEKNADSATITIKLGIELSSEIVSDANHPEGDLKVKPTFKHDVSSVMQIKAKRSGILSGENELLYNKETNEYILVPIDDGQITFFENRENTMPKPVSPFERLLPYVGRDMYIQKTDFGYCLFCEDECVITYYEPNESPLYLPQDLLYIHSDEGLECVLVEKDGVRSIQIVGIESDVVLVSVFENDISNATSTVTVCDNNYQYTTPDD